jgi:hypothetical protein
MKLTTVRERIVWIVSRVDACYVSASIECREGVF